MATINSLLASMGFPARQTIALVDVGARWGANAPWNQLDQRYVSYLGFEPDEAECRTLLEKRTSPNVDYLPVALHEGVGEHTLHVTREPGCSSILPPNRKRMSGLFLSERWDVEKRIPVRTVPLESVLAERRIAPDALKVDVQGAALNVLKGAGRYLREILVIDVEVEFCDVYEGQALFGDVDRHLRQFGFELLDLNKYHARRRILGSECVSRGQVIFADALYVVSPLRFYQAEMDGAIRLPKLWNVIATLCLYGHFDLALEFACHQDSPLAPDVQQRIRHAIYKYTAISKLRLLLFDNALAERVGLLASLMASAIRVASRRAGWGSDQSAVDGRYKYYLVHPLLRLFRK